MSSKNNSIRSLITCVYRQRWTWFLQFSPANKAFKYLRVLGRLFFVPTFSRGNQWLHESPNHISTC